MNGRDRGAIDSWRRAAVLAVILLATACRPHSGRTIDDRHASMRFIVVPAGQFDMGSPVAEPGREDGEHLHRVRITRPFAIAATEVTVAQWQAIMRTDPSHFRSLGPEAPVEGVTWFEAHEFLARLNRGSNARYRLPTESEWEYACRAGTSTAYASGRRLTSSDANFDARYPLPAQAPGLYRAAPTRVASFAPNRWGLYDMHGNVWEWCEDDVCPYPESPVTDPMARCASGLKVIRGGSWYFNAASARSALRYTHRPHDRGFSLGFRVVRDPS